MTRGEWGMPFAFGLTATIGVALLAHAMPHALPVSSTVVPAFAISFEAGMSDQLVIAQGDRVAAMARLSQDAPGLNVSWHESVGYVHAGSRNAESAPRLEEHSFMGSPDQPRFGVDGFNATQATVYVFFGNGNLLASNADLANVSRFTLDSRFTHIGHEAWYLGDGARTPNGTVRLGGAVQPILQQLRPSLVGTPEGGINSMLVSQYPGSFVLGELHVTARIDRLVRAP